MKIYIMFELGGKLIKNNGFMDYARFQSNLQLFKPHSNIFKLEKII